MLPTLNQTECSIVFRMQRPAHFGVTVTDPARNMKLTAEKTIADAGCFTHMLVLLVTHNFRCKELSGFTTPRICEWGWKAAYNSYGCCYSLNSFCVLFLTLALLNREPLSRWEILRDQHETLRDFERSTWNHEWPWEILRNFPQDMKELVKTKTLCQVTCFLKELFDWGLQVR